ncbi:MAG: hypothetical protein LBI69_01170 [Puniceicoccales bacterium]|jgi:hypothetical protein|nr:hypothetical protein [Puniceicoccales bacterium]
MCNLDENKKQADLQKATGGFFQSKMKEIVHACVAINLSLVMSCVVCASIGAFLILGGAWGALLLIAVVPLSMAAGIIVSVALDLVVATTWSIATMIEIKLASRKKDKALENVASPMGKVSNFVAQLVKRTDELAEQYGVQSSKEKELVSNIVFKLNGELGTINLIRYDDGQLAVKSPSMEIKQTCPEISQAMVHLLVGECKDATNNLSEINL